MNIINWLHWFTSDQGLMALVTQNWLIGVSIVALVIFCETGLVVAPFLPGDSLLFTTGTLLGAAGVPVALPAVMIILAAILGDLTNFSIGRSALGQQIVRRGWITSTHMATTRNYFDRFGGSTVTIGRFVPIVRTIAPFMAGLSGMHARRFALFNLLGALLWGGGMLASGFWLGQIPWVKAHLSWMTIGIIILSLLPVAWQLWANHRIGSRSQEF